MPITLGLNISSLKAQNKLARSSSELSSTFERLSSGQRINRASDDTAGLAIADSLSADARVFTQGIRNLNDGLSILNVADGALQELTNITFRLTELAEQAANGTLGSQQRAALDEEAQALSDEYFRIVQSTEFNDRQLFTADYGELRLQAGYGLDASIGDGLGGAVGIGSFVLGSAINVSLRPESLSTGDFNGDGILDVVSANYGASDLTVAFGNGDGTFGSTISYVVGMNPSQVLTEDINGDGILDLLSADTTDGTVSVLLGNGDGTFGDVSAFSVGNFPFALSATDFNNDGAIDLVSADAADDTVSILLGDGNGLFGAASAVSVGTTPTSVATTDFNNDGIIDILTSNSADGELSVLLGNGDGTFLTASNLAVGDSPVVITTADFNEDGIIDIASANVNSGDHELSILIGNGDGSFGAAITIATGVPRIDISTGDFNGDGHVDLVTASSDGPVDLFLGNGDGAFEDTTVYSDGGSLSSIVTGDFDGDGVLDILASDLAIGSNTIDVLLGEATDGVSPLLDFSLTSIADAKQALSQFTQKLDQLTEQRGQIGAFQARVEVAENVLQVTTENYQAAESRIRDADIAQEAADLVRLQILQQSSTAVLGQANLQPQLVLELLADII